MNVLYTCDNNYVMLMGLSMISLFKVNINADEINVYLIGENISNENKTILKNIANEYKRKCIIIDLPELKLSQNLYFKRWPKSAYTRLFCGEILPEEVKKIIYIDCDTIVKESLADLYKNENIEKYIVSGVKECISDYYKKNIGLSNDNVYINAGVLVINVDLLRKRDISKEIETFVNKYSKKINYADQDALNYMFSDSIGILEPKYNVMTIEFVYDYKDIIKLRRPKNYYTKEEIKESVQKPYIIHYTTNMTTIRPWYKNSDHPRKDDFLEIYYDNKYFSNKLEEFSTNSVKYKFLRLFLSLPKGIGYGFLGFVHSKVVPVIKGIKVG